MPRFFKKETLTGGTSNALDGIDGDDIIDGDICFTYIGSSGTSQEYKYEHKLDDDISAAEASPYYINPDANPGTKGWVLQSVAVQSLVSGATKSGAYTITATDNFTDIFGSGSGVTITLPTAAIPRRMRVIKTDGAANVLGVETNGGDTVEGDSAKQLLNRYDSIAMVTHSGSTTWYEI